MNLRISIFLLCSTLSAADTLRPNELVTEVLAHHPELGFYEAELAAAKAGRTLAGTRADPELSVELGHISSGLIAASHEGAARKGCDSARCSDRAAG